MVQQYVTLFGLMATEDDKQNYPELWSTVQRGKSNSPSHSRQHIPCPGCGQVTSGQDLLSQSQLPSTQTQLPQGSGSSRHSAKRNVRKIIPLCERKEREIRK